MRARPILNLTLTAIVLLATTSAAAQDQPPQPTPPPPGPSVQITVERTAAAVGEPFWIEVTVRWPAQTQSASVVTDGRSGQVGLAPNSPFEVISIVQSGVSMQMATDQNGALQVNREQRLRWQVRATQPGSHEVVVLVGGKLFRDQSAVVSVQPAGPGAGGTI